MNKTLKILAGLLIAGTTVAGVLMFGGDSAQTPVGNIQDKTAASKTVPDLVLENRTIEFTHTDDNSGEELLIYSDKSKYTGFRGSDFYIAVENTDQMQRVNIRTYFEKEGRKFADLKRIYPQKEIVKTRPIFTEKCTTKEMVSSTTDKIIYKEVCEQVKTGTKEYSVYRDVFEERPEVSFSSQKATPDKPKNWRDGDIIKSGNVAYYKGYIKYPPNSKGKFSVEAIGEKGARGLLDPAFDDSSCEGYVEITSDNTKVDNANDNIMYDLSLIGGASDFWSTITEAGDIRVTNSAGDTAYSFEVENFSTASNTGIVYFDSSNLVTGSDVTWRLYVCTAKSMPAETDTLGAQNVWSSSDKAIYHMDDDPASGGTVYDSTANNNDGTADSTMTSGDLVSGKVGQTIDFDGSDDLVDLPNNFDTILDGSNNFVISVWINTQDLTTDYLGQVMLERNQVWLRNDDSDNFVLHIRDSGGTVHGVSYAVTNLSTGTWFHVLGRFQSGSRMSLWINGVERDYKNITFTNTQFNDFDDTLGGSDRNSRYAPTKLDEVRIRQGFYSDNWLTTEYNNQSSPSTFWATGSWTSTAAPVEKELLRPFIQWFN